MSRYRAKRLLGMYGEVEGYEYRDTVIDKSYYADGPSMFVWQIVGFGPDRVTEWNTLRAAKAYIDAVKDDANG